MTEERAQPVGFASLTEINSNSPKAPQYRANVCIYDVATEIYELAFWPATDKDGNLKVTRNGEAYWTGPIKDGPNKVGYASLFVVSSQNPSAPQFSISLQFDDQRNYRVGLWGGWAGGVLPDGQRQTQAPSPPQQPPPAAAPRRPAPQKPMFDAPPF
jgi:hypothetical protein